MRYNTTSISQSMAAKAIQGLGAIPTQEPEYVDLRKQATVLCLTDNENKMETACNPEGKFICLDLILFNMQFLINVESKEYY